MTPRGRVLRRETERAILDRRMDRWERAELCLWLICAGLCALAVVCGEAGVEHVVMLGMAMRIIALLRRPAF